MKKNMSIGTSSVLLGSTVIRHRDLPKRKRLKGGEPRFNKVFIPSIVGVTATRCIFFYGVYTFVMYLF